MTEINIRGITYKVVRSPRKNKKFRTIRKSDGKVIADFGAKGYRIKRGTPAGNSYCARSSGIKGQKNINTPNFWSRLKWNCQGKKSLKKKII